MRNYIFTTEPDVPMAIFCDQISWVRKDGAGCIVRTSDGCQHNFLRVPYEDMLQNILAAEKEPPK